MENKFLLASEAARELGIAAQTVRDMEKAGKLPAAIKTAGGVRLFHRAAVRRLRLQRAEKDRAAK